VIGDRTHLQPGAARRNSTDHLSLITYHLAAALLAAALSGCGTTAKRDTTKPPPRSGGYYLDDGPGVNPPANIDNIPDAVPRAEPMNRGTSRPYVVMGKTYTPMTALAHYKARGIASWYGRRYHGKQTSSGELYDMYAMTAAHTTLPLPSYARVTNLKNGRSVVVRVNDRGPFVEGRIIDLSYTAAHKLGVLAGGNAMVEVEAIIPGRSGTIAAPAPRYPLASRRSGEQGTVTLRVLVTREGLPARVDVEKSSGSPHLDAAALQAVKAWRFTPARQSQNAIESWMLVPVVFRLEGTS